MDYFLMLANLVKNGLLMGLDAACVHLSNPILAIVVIVLLLFGGWYLLKG